MNGNDIDLDADYTKWLQENHSYLKNYARRLLASTALDASGAVQSTIRRVLTARSSFRGSSTASFLAWHLRILRNVCLRILSRPFHRRRQLIAGDSEAAEFADPRASPDEETLANEITDAIETELRALTPIQRAVFVGKHCHGLSFSDLAKQFQMTKGMISNHHRMAIRLLRQRLGRFGGEFQ